MQELFFISLCFLRPRRPKIKFNTRVHSWIGAVNVLWTELCDCAASAHESGGVGVKPRENLTKLFVYSRTIRIILKLSLQHEPNITSKAEDCRNPNNL